MDDWSLYMLHLPNQENTVPTTSRSPRDRDEGFISFGPKGKNETVTHFANRVIDLLHNHGVQLEPTEVEGKDKSPCIDSQMSITKNSRYGKFNLNHIDRNDSFSTGLIFLAARNFTELEGFNVLQNVAETLTPTSSR